MCWNSTLIIKTLITLLAAYAALCLLMYLVQDKYIFYPPSSNHLLSTIPPENLFSIEVNDKKLNGFYVFDENHSNKKSLIYFGGNAENVFYNYYDFMRQLDVNFFAVNYPGFAGNGGKLTLDGFVAQNGALYSAIIKQFQLSPSDTIVMGRSIGAAAAIHLCEKYSPAGVVAITPFDSLVKVGEKHFPFLPVALLLKDPLNNTKVASQCDSPLLVIVAGSDNIIPPQHAKALYDSWRGDNKTFVTIKNKGHNDLHLDLNYYLEISKFIGQLER